MGSIQSFLDNTGSTIIGTLVGVGVALGGDRWLAARRRADERNRSLQAVADRIFHARALRPVQKKSRAKVRVLAQEEEEDRDRCARSVLETRDLIQQVIGRLRPTDPAQEGLIEMHAACLRYLSNEVEEPASYVEHLQNLRQELDVGQRKLHAVYPELVIREPGSAELIGGP